MSQKRLQEDLELLRTYRLARMSVATMAMMLGRSAKWVDARLAEMEKGNEDVDAGAICEAGGASGTAVVAPQEEPSGSPHPDGGASARASDSSPVCSAVAPECGSPQGETIAEPRRSPGHAINVLRRGHRPESVTRLRAVTPRVLGYARRFLAASWQLDEVADLFDVAADELEAALSRAVTRA